MRLHVTTNAKVSDGSQPPMTFAFHSESDGWLPFAGPPGSVILFVLDSRINTTGNHSRLQFAMSSSGTEIIHILSGRG